MVLDGQRVEEVQKLLNTPEEECCAYLQLASDLKKLDTLLQSNAEGSSLESLYTQIPSNLKGMIELVYDINHHPAIRLIEPIFYQHYYSDKSQSFSLSEGNHDHRSFVMSTPRIEKKEEICLHLSFSDSRYDTLFSMRYMARTYDEIKEQLSMETTDEIIFKSFFTETVPLLSKDRHYICRNCNSVSNKIWS